MNSPRGWDGYVLILLLSSHCNRIIRRTLPYHSILDVLCQSRLRAYRSIVFFHRHIALPPSRYLSNAHPTSHSLSKTRLLSTIPSLHILCSYLPICWILIFCLLVRVSFHYHAITFVYTSTINTVQLLSYNCHDTLQGCMGA